jgi:hypothetical protein
MRRLAAHFNGVEFGPKARCFEPDFISKCARFSMWSEREDNVVLNLKLGAQP